MIFKRKTLGEQIQECSDRIERLYAEANELDDQVHEAIKVINKSFRRQSEKRSNGDRERIARRQE
jgi:hypothetical protein